MTIIGEKNAIYFSLKSQKKLYNINRVTKRGILGGL